MKKIILMALTSVLFSIHSMAGNNTTCVPQQKKVAAIGNDFKDATLVTL